MNRCSFGAVFVGFLSPLQKPMVSCLDVFFCRVSGRVKDMENSKIPICNINHVNVSFFSVFSSKTRKPAVSKNIRGVVKQCLVLRFV